MILDGLFNLVNELRERIQTHGGQLRSNEMQTRYALIDPLLRELGWDTSDPALVTPEYSASGGRADYALLDGGKPVVMVEAKKLGEDLQGAVTQGITYCIGQGTPHFAVTDGQRWEIYETHRPVPVAQKKLVEFNVLNDAPAAVCLDALALWRPGVQSSSVRAGQKPVVEMPESPAISPTTVVIPPSPVITGPEWKPLDEVSLTPDEKGRQTPPEEIAFPDGVVAQVKNWRQVTTSVASWLVEKGHLTEKHCPIRVGRGRRYIIAASPTHANGNQMTSYVAVGSLYLEVNYSARNHVRNTKAIIERVGQDPSQFKLRFP